MADVGFSPYEETALRRRLRMGGMEAQGIARARRAYTDQFSQAPVRESEHPGAKPEPAPEESGGLRGALRDYLTGGGINASLQGLGSVPRGANFGTAFLAAAGGAGRATTSLDLERSKAAMEARRAAREEAQAGRDEKRLTLEEQRVKNDTIRANREKAETDPAGWRNYQKLLEAGYPKERAAELAFGSTVQQRADLKETPQGTEDVNAIAAHYGVSPETARVMKVSGATRIRPKQVVTESVDPYSGKPVRKVTTVNEPVQLLTERELSSMIGSLNDPQKLQQLASGDMPDEVPDDAGLHQRLQALAARRLQAISAPPGALRSRND